MIRDHEIISDQPFGFNGQNKGPKPSELVLAALAACQETTYRIFAEDMGIEIGEISVQLKGTQDLRGFMALDDKIPAGFTNIVGQIFIQSDATEEELELLRQRVDQHCPVLDDLKRPVEVASVNKEALKLRFKCYRLVVCSAFFSKVRVSSLNRRGYRSRFLVRFGSLNVG